MFVGAIESEFRRWFDLNKAAFAGRTLHVGCSGNFTVEQLVGSIASAVHSNDVSIYSHFLGHALAGQSFRWEIKLMAYRWLQPYLERDPAALMVLLFELLKWEPERNAFNRRMHQAMLAAWDEHFEQTVERVQHARETARLTTFRSSDIWDFADEAGTLDPGGVFVAFLPFYKGGYERLYKKLDEIFDWDRPKYQVIDAARKQQLIEKIKRFDHVFIDDVEYPGEPAVMLKRKTDSKRMWLYSNMDLSRVLVQYHRRVEPSYYELLTEADVARIKPDTTIVFKKVKAAEMNYYRNRFLAKTINFVDGSWNFLVFADGRLFGFVILVRPKAGMSDGLYVLSDFVVAIGRPNRLAKLLLLLMQSTHFREICEELLVTRVGVLSTTAFTDKPVSTKYRGVFALTKRGQQPGGGKKFLNYETPTGIHSEREAIEKWMKYKQN